MEGDTAVAQWLRCCATYRKVAGSVPGGVTGFFIDIKSFPLHYGPGVDSASNRNEYQEYFLAGKGSRCLRLTTCPHPVPLSWNLWALNSWIPLGLSCNGTALPLPLLFFLLIWGYEVDAVIGRNVPTFLRFCSHYWYRVQKKNTTFLYNKLVLF